MHASILFRAQNLLAYPCKTDVTVEIHLKKAHTKKKNITFIGCPFTTHQLLFESFTSFLWLVKLKLHVLGFIFRLKYQSYQHQNSYSLRCTSRHTPLSERLEQANKVKNTLVIYNLAAPLCCCVKNRGLKLSPRHSVKKSTLLPISPNTDSLSSSLHTKVYISNHYYRIPCCDRCAIVNLSWRRQPNFGSSR